MDKLLRVLNSRILNIFIPIADFLHIFQLEEYNYSSFLKWTLPRLHKRNLQKVGSLEWTGKAKLFFALTLVLILATSIFLTILVFGDKAFYFVPIFLINILITPLWLVTSSLLLLPLDVYLKNRAMVAAKKKLSQMQGLKIIAVAGSVGKTTTRQIIFNLMRNKRKVFTPKGNFNTLLGISQEINASMPNDSEVLVIELGEYRPGDLLNIVKFAKPEILVYTKVGSQHIDKFASQKSLNEEFLSIAGFPTIKMIFINQGNQLIPDLQNRNPDVVKNEKKHLKNTPLPDTLSFSENLNLAVAVARYMGITDEEIYICLSKLTTIDRRLNVTVQNGITVIDDTYNISVESAENAFDFVKKQKGRKIIITGGIVDQGKESTVVNNKFGQNIAGIFDVAIVAKNDYFDPIVAGMASNPKLQLLVSKNPVETPILLKSVLMRGDVVLIQNELPEVYWH